ncbi:MAG: hypothetical protein UY61_C0022G0013 [Candidatus Adlerbacteria bacterium GW2011_GWC1_50_9]|uniref:Uncharacterized protein n=1 Tax=Candidatus Adlerbacteria bacterium GW2011_GWC1_50_9 TaxID=1618608 RepID=A0A0G1WPT9_9BACT|nr:MAG: hypothetical protein UY61_C0022G0013 [Candidatus Adlerbacteria bacterium GW2011_GWC1_50_9]
MKSKVEPVVFIPNHCGAHLQFRHCATHKFIRSIYHNPSWLYSPWYPNSMASFEKRKPTEETEIPSSESITVNMELALTPEHREVMERHKRGRLELLRDFITSRTVDVAMNFMPGIDVPKLAIEGMLGKTLSNEKLTLRKRFDYMLISGGIALSYVLAVFGTPEPKKNFRRRLDSLKKPHPTL